MSDAGEPSLAERLAHRRERHIRRGRAYRVLWTVAGIAITLVGVAMLALPGPAFVVIPVGLTMLAMEFDWAERWLERALGEAEKAQRRAQQASRTQKILGTVATGLAIAAVVVVALLYDIPLVPDP